MKAIVPAGYAVPKKEIERLTAELRESRAPDLAKANEKQRARIEKEIAREVRRKAMGTAAGTDSSYGIGRHPRAS